MHILSQLISHICIPLQRVIYNCFILFHLHFSSCSHFNSSNRFLYLHSTESSFVKVTNDLLVSKYNGHISVDILPISSVQFDSYYSLVLKHFLCLCLGRHFILIPVPPPWLLLSLSFPGLSPFPWWFMLDCPRALSSFPPLSISLLQSLGDFIYPKIPHIC